MSSLITVPPTWKSPRSEARRRLSAEIARRESLLESDRREMYGLMQAYFENTSYQRFLDDLAEKETVILLRDPRENRLAGFSTLMKLDVEAGGRKVVGFFSGDTIVAREYWGVSFLGTWWAKAVFDAADEIALESPYTPLYWFLICSGYKTWRYLPTCFRRYLPHPAQPAGEFDRSVLHALARSKFGDDYDAASGIVRFRHANPLRSGVADLTERRLRDPLVEFFARKNPGHVRGDELACLVRISRDNLTPAGRRLLEAAR